MDMLLVRPIINAIVAAIQDEHVAPNRLAASTCHLQDKVYKLRYTINATPSSAVACEKLLVTMIMQ